MRSNLKHRGYQFTIIAIIILFSIVMSFQGKFNLGEDSIQVDPYQINEINEVELKTSPVSGKISVNGNSDWINLKNAGKCTGLGTSSDPYIVKDLVIDGGGLGNCILIENSDVYFKIENCILYNSGNNDGDTGITLNNVENGKLLNNNCSYNKMGIHVSEGINNIISGNILNFNSDSGIQFTRGSHNLLSKNTICSNDEIGVYLYFSNEITIFGNNISKNMWVGVWWGNSNDNSFSGNNVSYNTEHGIGMAQSDDNVVEGNIVSHNGLNGIDVMDSDNNLIDLNIINNNNVGIILDSDSHCNIVFNNNFSGNTEDIVDNQGECIIEIPFLFEIAIAVGIVFISITVATGLILKRRKSTIEVKRFKKHAKREAEKKLLVEKRKKPVKLEFVETEKRKEKN